MIKRITDVLNNNKDKENILFYENDSEITYKDFVIESKKVGSGLLKYKETNKPIAIFIDKSIKLASSMIGTIYSGNFYTVIDVHMPKDRILSILETLNPITIITTSKLENKLKEITDFNYDIYEELVESEILEEELENISKKIIDTDPMYILFTSGSTGKPKGTVLSHIAVLTYTDWFIETFDINETTIFGSQTPFYFSMSVSDFYSTLKVGATMCLIPKMYFSFPVKLLDYLNDKKVNTIYWVPSALGIISNFKALDSIDLPHLKKVLFAGEVMPMKVLNYFRKHVDAMYANLFGPTETTDICTYYIVDREFKDDEVLPIGKACNNCGILILDEDLKESNSGELYVRGSFLADGYYKCEDKTTSAFVLNPLNNAYPEILYKTGDLVKMENDEIIYLGRKDFQIKHMGYRIELGEIEANVSSFDSINTCACIYDLVNRFLVLYYTGDIESDILLDMIKKKVPAYMVPNRIIKLDRMPYNANGKIDRVMLKKRWEEEDGKSN